MAIRGKRSGNSTIRSHGLGGRRNPLHARIKDLLRSRIVSGQIRPGDRAPSENEIKSEFDVSSITARRCLNDLEHEGHVQRVQGKGTFVRERDPLKDVRQIGIFYHELASLGNSYASNLLRGIYDGMDVSYQPELVSWALIRQHATPAAAVAEVVRQRSIDGILIISPAPLTWFDEILDAHVPVVSVNMEYEDDRAFCVTSDPRPGVERLAKKFLDLGHRKMVVVKEVFPGTAPGMISASELARWPDASLRVSLETLAYGSTAQATAIVEKHLHMTEPPSLFVVNGYELALLIRQAIEAKGLSIPEHVSLIQWGTTPGPSKIYTELVMAEQMGREAARALGTLMAGHVPPQRVARIPTRPAPGMTLGRAPSSVLAET